MSRSVHRGSVVLLLLATPIVQACNGPPEPERTLPQSVQQANPSLRFDSPEGAPTAATVAQYVRQLAQVRASAPYSPPDSSLPAGLDALDYDQHRSIRFRPEAALWRGDSAFELQLMHRGSVFKEAVPIYEIPQDGGVGADTATAVVFNSSLFSYEGAVASIGASMGAGVGFAGFRVHYPLNDPVQPDEIAVFQGASYFRLVGPGQVYGLSSRGLAVDVALESGEEFPDFRAFWLLRPGPEDSTLVFHALLDSPSVTGAYRFELTPGSPTQMSVEARLFARVDVAKLGVAPMSSMFLHGPNHGAAFDDYRPRVHDSEGLMAHTGRGEWIWRPLGNGRGLRVTSLRDEDPRGFGLAQRTREFEHYLDLEAQYHRRPSQWVQIEAGDWGSGGVELLEIPTDSEFNDNIAAYWVPDTPFEAGEERVYRYRLVLFDDVLDASSIVRVERTRIGWDALPGQADPPPRSQRRFVVDFVGASGQPPVDSIQTHLETSAGVLTDIRTQPLPDATGWRVSFSLRPDGNRPADMRLYLAQVGEPLTETWSYVWYPE